MGVGEDVAINNVAVEKEIQNVLPTAIRGKPCTNRPTEDSPGEPLARAHRRLAST